MSVYRTVSEILSVKEWRDLETAGRGRWRSLKITPFDRLYTTFYWSAIVSIVVCCTIFNSIVSIFTQIVYFCTVCIYVTSLLLFYVWCAFVSSLNKDCSLLIAHCSSYLTLNNPDLEKSLKVIQTGTDIIQRQITQKRYQIELYLQWRANRKSYMVYRTAPVSMTLNNL